MEFFVTMGGEKSENLAATGCKHVEPMWHAMKGDVKQLIGYQVPTCPSHVKVAHLAHPRAACSAQTDHFMAAHYYCFTCKFGHQYSSQFPLAGTS